MNTNTKNINLKRVFLPFILITFLIINYNCEVQNKSTTKITDNLPISDFSFTVSSDNYLKYTFTNSSTNADNYAWDFGDNKTSTDKNPSHTYDVPTSYPKEYIVRLVALNGINSNTKQVKLTISDPKIINPIITSKEILTGKNGTDKVWKIMQEEKSFFVAPSDISLVWWSFSKADITKRKSIFATEYIFTTDNKFKRKVDINAGVWVETGVISASSQEDNVPIASLDKSIEGNDLKPWGSSDAFTYTWTDKVTSSSVATLAVSGLGSYIGLPKASGDGTKQYPNSPTLATTYVVKKIADGGTNPDTLIIEYSYTDVNSPTGKAVWITNLVSYKTTSQEPVIIDQVPKADFTATKSTSNTKVYTFTNKSTSVLPMTYKWDFGDGQTSTDKDPMHTYTTEASFTVSLITTNSVGNSAPKTKIISTSATNNGDGNTLDNNVPQTKGTRSLAWNDEFNTTFDATKWEVMIGDGSTYGIPGWGNNEEQYYQGSNISVESGKLIITAKRESVGGKNFTSARIRTKNKGDWKFGWIEARIKLPNSTQGIWPAFWMLPTGGSRGWPADGEIDIMEWIGRDNTTLHGTIHYGETTHEQKTFQTSDGVDYGGTWHIFAIEWTQDNIKWYLDESQFGSISKSETSSFPFNDLKFHILLNMAIGGNWPGGTNSSTEVPQTLEVDYVRVYQ